MIDEQWRHTADVTLKCQYCCSMERIEQIAIMRPVAQSGDHHIKID